MNQNNFQPQSSIVFTHSPLLLKNIEDFLNNLENFKRSVRVSKIFG